MEEISRKNTDLIKRMEEVLGALVNSSEQGFRSFNGKTNAEAEAWIQKNLDLYTETVPRYLKVRWISYMQGKADYMKQRVAAAALTGIRS